MKHIKIIVIISVVFSQLNAQEQPSNDEIMRQFKFQPIEPTTASLGRYGEYQMDYSNGLPDISITLYEIKSGDLTVPIVLRYQGGGIKVQQEATWVGLGWDLFYGGQITRVMHGFPDEKEPSASQRPTANQIRTYMQQHNSEADNTYLKSLAEGKDNAYSFMPDEFYFNAGIESGKFIGMEEKVLMPYKPVKVSGNNYGWNITDAEGIRYSYDASETTSHHTPDHSLGSYTSAWGIKSIKSSNGHIINYEYQVDGNYRFNHTPSYEGYKYSYIEPYAQCYLMIDPYLYGNKPIHLKRSPGYMKVVSAKPQYIYFNGGRITFTLTSRTDIVNADSSPPVQKLSTIYIQRLLSDGTYEAVKYFQFNYFERDNRLFLESVDEYIFSPHSFKQIAKFEYDNTTLPPKNSYKYDYCGYYNGSNNTTPIPLYNFQTNYGTITIGGADKSVVEDFTKAGSLTAIEYPTKGKTVFTWENNRYGASSPIFENNIYQPVNVSVFNSCDREHDFEPFWEDDDDCGLTSGKGFKCYVNQTIRIQGQIIRNITTDLAHNKSDSAKILFKNVTDNTTIILIKLYTGADIINVDEIVNLQAGKSYGISATTNCTNISINANFTYNAYNPATNQYNYPYGGLRIKEIANYESDGKLLEKLFFTYKQPDNPNRSSGYITNDSDFLLYKHSKYADCISFRCSIDSPGLLSLYKYTETFLYYDNPITGIYPNNLSYQYVQVQSLNSENQNIGITKYEFKTHLDEQMDDILPVISNSGLRGQLLNEKIYNNKNQLLRETTNFYSNHSGIDFSTRGLKVKKGINLGVICSNVPPIWNLDILYVPLDYTYNSKWLKKDNTITRDYFGDQYVETNTTYTYNDLNSCLPTKVVSFYDGNEKMVNYEYFNQRPVVREEKINNQPVVKLTINYSAEPLCILCPPAFKINSVNVKYKNETTVAEIIVNLHDSNNNILEYQTKDNVPVTMIWGYKRKYLIAEIRNATYEDVLAKITNIETIAEKIAPIPSDFTKINNLRIQLPDAMVTTFKYLPLVGISEITDPKGISTYYIYDNFGRLKEIKIGEKSYPADIEETKRLVENYLYKFKINE